VRYFSRIKNLSIPSKRLDNIPKWLFANPLPPTAIGYPNDNFPLHGVRPSAASTRVAENWRLFDQNRRPAAGCSPIKIIAHPPNQKHLQRAHAAVRRLLFSSARIKATYTIRRTESEHGKLAARFNFAS
jgi:hypothetical protein